MFLSFSYCVLQFLDLGSFFEPFACPTLQVVICTRSFLFLYHNHLNLCLVLCFNMRFSNDPSHSHSSHRLWFSNEGLVCMLWSYIRRDSMSIFLELLRRWAWLWLSNFPWKQLSRISSLQSTSLRTHFPWAWFGWCLKFMIYATLRLRNRIGPTISL